MIHPSTEPTQGLTSGVAGAPLSARGGAVCGLLEVGHVHGGVGGAETLLEPLHQVLH